MDIRMIITRLRTSKLVKGLLCVSLFAQSLSGVGITVYAEDGTSGNSAVLEMNETIETSTVSLEEMTDSSELFGELEDTETTASLDSTSAMDESITEESLEVVTSEASSEIQIEEQSKAPIQEPATQSVEQRTLRTVVNPVQEENAYGTVANKNYQLYADESLQQGINDKQQLFNQTIHITKSVTVNNLLYYGISDKNGWLGFVNAASVTLATGNQGIPQAYQKYVSVKGSHNIWNGFDFKMSKPVANYKNQTLQAREVYSHFNGARYLSLYTNQGVLLGYIDETGVTVAPGNQGVPQAYSKYVSIRGHYNIWSDFDWKTSQLGSNYKNQTFEARESYTHFNGSTYLSLYNNKGALLGYINAAGVTVAKGRQGVHQKYGKFVTLKGYYDIWDGFSFKTKKLGKDHKGKTYQARGIYHHFNGLRYLSIYDNKGNWLGYINPE